MIACILPSRGLVFSEVIGAIERERELHKLRVYISDNLPIPDAQNELIGRAIEDEKALGKFTHFWFIEEDTVPPSGSLGNLMDSKCDITCVDYSVSGWSCITRDRNSSEIMWCGMGCTLVKREVLAAIGEPWFKTDKSLRLNDGEWIDTNAEKVYGQQDIRFCIEAKAEGFTIGQADGECRHLQLHELGKPEVNKGLHKIGPKLKIEKYQLLEKGVRDYSE